MLSLATLLRCFGDAVNYRQIFAVKSPTAEFAIRPSMFSMASKSCAIFFLELKKKKTTKKGQISGMARKKKASVVEVLYERKVVEAVLLRRESPAKVAVRSADGTEFVVTLANIAKHNGACDLVAEDGTPIADAETVWGGPESGDGAAAAAAEGPTAETPRKRGRPRSHATPHDASSSSSKLLYVLMSPLAHGVYRIGETDDLQRTMSQSDGGMPFALWFLFRVAATDEQPAPIPFLLNFLSEFRVRDSDTFVCGPHDVLIAVDTMCHEYRSAVSDAVAGRLG